MTKFRVSSLMALALSVTVSEANAATFYPTTAAELIANITTANSNSQEDFIFLGGYTFILTGSDNTDGYNCYNGLPAILPDSGNALNIVNGAIEANFSDLPFRFFYVEPSARLHLSNVTLANGLSSNANDCSAGGGAILNEGELTLKGCQFIANQSSGTGTGGGAILNNGGFIPIISKTTFIENFTEDFVGGAIQNIDGFIYDIVNSTFEANYGAGAGGAISNFGEIGNISSSTFAYNLAISGGAIYEGPIGAIYNIENSTFTNNVALGEPLYGENHINYAPGFGGAIYIDSSCIDAINNCTFASNTAAFGGGGIAVYDGNIGFVISSIVALNVAGIFGSDINLYDGSTITEASFNFIGTGTGNSITNGVDFNQVGTDISPLDPLLGPLQYNGGPTFTRALQNNSSAICAGFNPLRLPWDQRGRGFSRNSICPGYVLGTDIGAFQFHPKDAHADSEKQVSQR